MLQSIKSHQLYKSKYNVLFVCFWPINRHVFVLNPQLYTPLWLQTLVSSGKDTIKDPVWKTRFSVKGLKMNKTSISCCDPWRNGVYACVNTMSPHFSMKHKSFGHLKPRLFTIKTSKHVGLGGPWYIYIYIYIVLHDKAFL